MSDLLYPCPECGGSGRIEHPSWGSRTCPEPTIPCPSCGGSGECEYGSAAEREAAVAS